MTVYVQGLSALAYYRSSNAKLGVEQCPLEIRSLEGATSSLARINDAKIWRLGIGEPTEDCPLEVLVATDRQRSRSRAINARVWKPPVPPKSFRQVTKDIYVSSPEFVFLQMATRVDLPVLAALGMELCGTYRRYVEASSPGTNELSYMTTYNQVPLTNPKRLRGFLDSMRSAPGCARATKALEYVLPDSASPMETAIHLLLCLPRRLGGYALPQPRLNPPIAFSKASKRYTLRNSAKPDLYWKDARLDLEYNSDEFHDENSRTIDSMRRKALERMDVEVIELTRVELFSTSLFHATVLRIARRLGKRVRGENEGDFAAKRAALRQCLLVDESGESSKEESASTSDAESEDAEYESVAYVDAAYEGPYPDGDITYEETYADEDSVPDEPVDEWPWWVEDGVDDPWDESWYIDVPDDDDDDDELEMYDED